MLAKQYFIKWFTLRIFILFLVPGSAVIVVKVWPLCHSYTNISICTTQRRLSPSTTAVHTVPSSTPHARPSPDTSGWCVVCLVSNDNLQFLWNHLTSHHHFQSRDFSFMQPIQPTVFLNVAIYPSCLPCMHSFTPTWQAPAPHLPRRRHKGEPLPPCEPLPCPDCGVELPTPAALREHRRCCPKAPTYPSDSAKRKFKCDRCPSAFAFRSSLVRHAKVSSPMTLPFKNFEIFPYRLPLWWWWWWLFCFPLPHCFPASYYNVTTINYSCQNKNVCLNVIISHWNKGKLVNYNQ